MSIDSAHQADGQRIAAGLVPISDINGDDDLDTTLLRQMSEEARRYISKFAWCGEILDLFFARGVGGIFAVFFFHIRPTLPEVDPWIWIMVGDIPPRVPPAR